MANAAVADDPELDLKVKKKGGGGGMMKIIMIVGGAVVMMAVSVGTAVYVSKSLIQDSISHGASAPAAHGESGGHGGDSHDAGQGGEGNAALGEAKYVKLGDSFVVNFLAGDQIRYLQVTIEVMTHDPNIPGAIETHLPVIRNNLVMLFSGLGYKTLSSVEGKQKIREEALHEVQKILEKRTGSAGIDDLYFTSFVMQ